MTRKRSLMYKRHRDGTAAKRFFKRLLRTSASEPRRIVTDKLSSYGVAHCDLTPDTTHDTSHLNAMIVIGEGKFTFQ